MNGYAAYQKNQVENENPRDVEYRLLGKVTAELIAVRDHEDATDPSRKVRALMQNRDVWSALKVDLLDPGNALPKELRANLISLAIFIERETFEVLDNRSDMETLIELNKTIMEGLRPQETELTQQENAAPPQDTAPHGLHSV